MLGKPCSQSARFAQPSAVAPGKTIEAEILLPAPSNGSTTPAAGVFNDEAGIIGTRARRERPRRRPRRPASRRLSHHSRGQWVHGERPPRRNRRYRPGVRATTSGSHRSREAHHRAQPAARQPQIRRRACARACGGERPRDARRDDRSRATDAGEGSVLVRRRLIAAVVFGVAACASIQHPPGGPPRHEPPEIIAITPDSNAIQRPAEDDPDPVRRGHSRSVGRQGQRLRPPRADFARGGEFGCLLALERTRRQGARSVSPQHGVPNHGAP